MNGFEYIRSYYKVPAYRLRWVRVEGRGEGIITGTHSAHLLIRLNGQKHARPYHPTDGITYYPQGARVPVAEAEKGESDANSTTA